MCLLVSFFSIFFIIRIKMKCEGQNYQFFEKRILFLQHFVKFCSCKIKSSIKMQSFSSSSFLKKAMLRFLCVFTVSSEIPKASAMALLVFPFIYCKNTSLLLAGKRSIAAKSFLQTCSLINSPSVISISEVELIEYSFSYLLPPY